MSDLTVGKIEQLTTNNLSNIGSIRSYINNLELNNKTKEYKTMNTNNIKEATHWIPRYDENVYSQVNNSGVTLDKPYRLYFDKFDKEYVILDDIGIPSLIWLVTKGIL